MSYYLYKKQETENGWKYTQEDEISLGGTKGKYCIASLLNNKIHREGIDVPPSDLYRWHISIKKELKEAGRDRHTIIIDLKPNAQNEKSLYELLNVYGVSSNNWTPILLHLDGLYVDEQCTDQRKFEKNEIKNAHQNIFTFLYLRNTIIEKEVKGSWQWPSASPTNSALLFPDALQYFSKCMRELPSQK